MYTLLNSHQPTSNVFMIDMGSNKTAFMLILGNIGQQQHLALDITKHPIQGG